MLKKIGILLLYLLLIFYSVELLLFTFISGDQKKLVNIHKTRIEKAKEKNIEPDLRTEQVALIEELKKNKNVSTKFYYNINFANLSIFKEKIKNEELIPFRGPINKLTVSCGEDLKYRLINNDMYGFKNPNYIYEKNIDVAILGDSYAEGLCMDENNDTPGHLRNLGINTINLGITGSGPLVSLAVFREYVEIFKPKNVIYFYFEGNDIGELEWEKNKTNLKKYLNNDYKQNHYERKKEIINFLKISEKEVLSFLDNYKNNVEDKNEFVSHLKDIGELTLLRGALKNIINFNKTNSLDEELFFSILNIMKQNTEKWQGNFILVYVPSWSRYFTKFNEDNLLFAQKEIIIDELQKRNIDYIDLESFFSKEKNKEQYYPLGYIGHFNSKGYKVIADLIKKKIDGK
tara:strand:+ start:8639 stop:9847 length:1209 start_codon:yes stop_codon:yes gene_type:complete